MPYDNIDDIENKIYENTRNYRERKQSIEADDSLSQTGKRDKIEEAKQTHYPIHQELKSQLEQVTNKEYKGIKNSLFNTSSNKSTADKLAYDKTVMEFAGDDNLADKVSNASELVTAKAALKAGYQRGNINVMQAVYDNFPSLQSGIEQLEDFEQNYVHEKMSNKRKLKRNMKLSAPEKPNNQI